MGCFLFSLFPDAAHLPSMAEACRGFRDLEFRTSGLLTDGEKHDPMDADADAEVESGPGSGSVIAKDPEIPCEQDVRRDSVSQLKRYKNDRNLQETMENL